jgi:hypothetical protein
MSIDNFDRAQEAYDRMLPDEDEEYDDDDGEDIEDFDRYDDRYDDDAFEEALQRYEDRIYNGGDI